MQGISKFTCPCCLHKPSNKYVYIPGSQSNYSSKSCHSKMMLQVFGHHLITGEDITKDKYQIIEFITSGCPQQLTEKHKDKHGGH